MSFSSSFHCLYQKGKKFSPCLSLQLCKLFQPQCSLLHQPPLKVSTVVQRQLKYKELQGFQEKIEVHLGTEQVFLHCHLVFIKFCHIMYILFDFSVSMDYLSGCAQTAFEKTFVFLAWLKQEPENLFVAFCPLLIHSAVVNPSSFQFRKQWPNPTVAVFARTSY